MGANQPAKPRLFIDAEVLFAGSASPREQGAAYIILRMAEITLIDALASEQVIAEAERNLEFKIPQALPSFRLLVSRCLKQVRDPTWEELRSYEGAAHPEDLPILVAAVREGCPWLVTFNTRHYQPGLSAITVLRPGDFLVKARHLLAHL